MTNPPYNRRFHYNMNKGSLICLRRTASIAYNTINEINRVDLAGNVVKARIIIDF